MFKNFLSKIVLGLTLTAIGANASDEVNVYSHRHYDTDKKLYKLFEEETGIKVNLVKAKAAELIKRIKSEGERTPADILYTVDAGNLETAKKEGILQKIDSENLKNNIPQYLRDKDDTWYGVTVRTRVVAIPKSQVGKIDIKTYEELADPKYKGMIMVRSSNNIYNQSLLAAMIAHHGVDYATKWAKGIVDNMAKRPKGNDIYQVAAIANGLGKIGIVNTYYVGKMSDSKNFAEKMAYDETVVLLPEFENGGTHINISGVGVVKYAKNKQNAIKLIEFLTSKKAQEIFANENYEYPVIDGVKMPEAIKSLSDYKRDDLYLGELGTYNKEAIKIFDNVGWR